MLRQQLPGSVGKKKPKMLAEDNCYVLKKLIGQGTFGKVFESVDTRTGKRVAIKQVLQDIRFKNRELEVISRLDNDNIIYMNDYYFVYRKQDAFLYLVMDYYDGNLQTYLKEKRKQKACVPREVIKLFSFQMFKALYYLQSNNCCHRDLKPPNILFNPETYQLRICDFGSAKFFDANEKNVAYICSRYYRAPQLLFQYSKYQTQIDIWSAGCILAQFLTLQPIFPGDSSLEQLIEIFKIIGTPSKEYLEVYAKDADGGEHNYPKIPKVGWERLLRRYKPEPLFVDLISKILVFQIEKRLKPLEVLMHPYFRDLVSPQYEEYTKRLPNLFDFDRLRNPRNAKQILELQQAFKSDSGKHTLKQKRMTENKGQNLQTSESTPQIKTVEKTTEV